MVRNHLPPPQFSSLIVPFSGHWNVFTQHFLIYTDRIQEICQERSENSRNDGRGMRFDTKLDRKAAQSVIGCCRGRNQIGYLRACCVVMTSNHSVCFLWEQSLRLLTPFYPCACICASFMRGFLSVCVCFLSTPFAQTQNLLVDSRCHGNSLTVASSPHSNRHWWGKYVMLR